MIKRTPPSSGDCSNITLRHNKKDKESHSMPEHLGQFMEEMKKMFEDLKVQQDSKFASLKAVVTEISTQNAGIQKSIDFLSSRYDEVMQKVEVLQNNYDKSQDYIRLLENKIEFLEKKECSTSIEIRNVPKLPKENKDALCRIVKHTSELIECKVDDSAIRHIFRVKAKNQSPIPSPIVVEFTTSSTKDIMIRSAREYNKNHSTNKLNTSQLKIEGSPRPIYITERLTYKTNRLYHLARELAKEQGFAYCWTTNGQVYIRKKDGATPICIKTENELVTLRQSI